MSGNVKYSTVPSIELTCMEDRAAEAARGRQSRGPDDFGPSGRAAFRDKSPQDRRRERLNTELLTASLDGDLGLVTSLLDAGASPNATCKPSGTTACHVATFLGHNDVLDLLLNRGASPTRRDAEGRQAAHLAAWGGNTVALMHLHLADMELRVLESPVRREDTPCDPAESDSWSHDHRQLTALISDNFTEGSTPLHLACKRNRLECVDFLLKLNVSVDARDADGMTAIDVVGASLPEDVCPPRDNGDNLVMTRMDADPWTDVSFKRKTMRNAPPNITADAIGKPVESPQIGIISYLMKKGAKLRKSTDENAGSRPRNAVVTPLHTAVENGDMEAIEYLISKNACMMTWNDKGEAALHLAVRMALLDPLKVMLALGPEFLDVRDARGRTALHAAVEREWAEGVSLLLEAKADTRATTNDNRTVLHLAAETGNYDMLRELLSVPESRQVMEHRDRYHLTAVCQAVYSNRLDCVELLCEYGAVMEIALPGEYSLLHIAAENDFLDIVRFLLSDRGGSSGAKDRRSKRSRGGETALHIAAKRGYAECAEALLGAGWDVLTPTSNEPDDAVNTTDSTALHLAAAGNHLDAIEVLLKYDAEGAALRAADGKGRRPLHVAALRGHGPAVKVLLQHGADVAATLTDLGGTRTALQLITYWVPQPIKILEEIFDSYIRVNNFPTNDPECEIEINYDVLLPRGGSGKQMTVLTALLNSSRYGLQERLLIHPIVETFLALKWQKLRTFFFVLVWFYILLTFSVTSLSFIDYVESDNIPKSLIANGRIISQLLLLISFVPIFIVELLNLSQMQKYYIRDIESWVKLVLFVGILTVCFLGPDNDYGRYIATVTVLLAWTEVLFLVARCPRWGYYILMFFKVATNLFKVLASFVCLLIGFTLTFMIVFNAAGPFPTVWQSFVKVIVMLNELDFAGAFPEDDKDGGGEVGGGEVGGGAFSAVARGLFAVFVVFMGIVLTNLMVGLAVSDITVLETQGRTQRLAKQIDFLRLLEMLLYNRATALCCRAAPSKGAASKGASTTVDDLLCVGRSVLVHPGVPRKGVFYTFPRVVRESVLEKAAQKQMLSDDPYGAGLQQLDSKIERLVEIMTRRDGSACSHRSSKMGSEKRPKPISEAILENIFREIKELRREVDSIRHTNVPRVNSEVSVTRINLPVPSEDSSELPTPVFC